MKKITLFICALFMSILYSHGQECEISVTIFDDDYWGDEVTWALLDGDDTVVLSGGPFGNGYSETQTIFVVNPPYTLEITQDGFFCDNTPSYLVTIDGTTVLSGTMPEQCDVTTLPLVFDYSGCLAPEPAECATAPIFPADGAIEVNAFGPITFTWTAPTSGPVPTSYSFYGGVDPDNLNLFATVTDTQFEIEAGAYNLLLYWQVIPTNGGVNATGCDVWSFTTESFPGYCLNNDFGSPYPFTTFTPSVCDGVTANSIVTNAYASEYSNVNVIAGQTYRFTSSAPDLITISYDGIVVDAVGVSEVTWTATTDGVVRFYTHLNDDECGGESVNRTKSVLCGASLSVDSFDTTALKVYPNPVKDVLNLTYTTEISSVAVYNMLGQVVLSKTVNANQESLNMSELNSGAYFVKVTINDRTETVRVIKQ